MFTSPCYRLGPTDIHHERNYRRIPRIWVTAYRRRIQQQLIDFQQQQLQQLQLEFQEQLGLVRHRLAPMEAMMRILSRNGRNVSDAQRPLRKYVSFSCS